MTRCEFIAFSNTFREVMPKTHMFAPGERRNVEIWVVAGYHRNLLFTDDSFQFARAMRQVQFVLQTDNVGRQAASEGSWARSELHSFISHWLTDPHAFRHAGERRRGRPRGARRSRDSGACVLI